VSWPINVSFSEAAGSDGDNTKLPSGTVLESLRQGLLISRRAPHSRRIKTYVSCTTLGRYAPGRHTRRLPAELPQCKVGQSRTSHFSTFRLQLPHGAHQLTWDRGAPIVSNLLPCRTGSALCTPMARSSFFPISGQFLPTSCQFLPTSCQFLSQTVSIALIRRAPVHSFIP
jgi:hypothetical protein